jgi:allophanate hydrolase subunit 2
MANGAIQIPGNGMPIVMRNDRQTIGGYPVIGTLSQAGLAILSQATSKQELTFVPSDIKNATIWLERIDLALKAVLNNVQAYRHYTNE